MRVTKIQGTAKVERKPQHEAVIMLEGAQVHEIISQHGATDVVLEVGEKDPHGLRFINVSLTAGSHRVEFTLFHEGYCAPNTTSKCRAWIR